MRTRTQEFVLLILEFVWRQLATFLNSFDECSVHLYPTLTSKKNIERESLDPFFALQEEPNGPKLNCNSCTSNEGLRACYTRHF